MVDAADHHSLELAKSELFALLDKPTMAGIPVLVLGNKCDLPTALNEKLLIDKMYVISACFDQTFVYLVFLLTVLAEKVL